MLYEKKTIILHSLVKQINPEENYLISKFGKKKKWNKDGDELIKLIHIAKIAEQGDTVYTINTPTDVQYDNQDEKKKTEYLSMADDINSIKASFKLK